MVRVRVGVRVRGWGSDERKNEETETPAVRNIDSFLILPWECHLRILDTIVGFPQLRLK